MPVATSSSVEPRLVVETGVAARIAAIVEPVAESLGYHIVRVRVTGLNGCTVQIMAEKHDGSMAIEDCEELSKVLSPVLAVEDPIKSAYSLEMSSPGIDRPLTRASEFVRWSGHQAKLDFSPPLNGVRKVRGTLMATTENLEKGHITVVLEDVAEGREPVLIVPLHHIVEARLILTDALVADVLKRAKALEKEQKKAKREAKREGKKSPALLHKKALKQAEENTENN